MEVGEVGGREEVGGHFLYLLAWCVLCFWQNSEALSGFRDGISSRCFYYCTSELVH